MWEVRRILTLHHGCPLLSLGAELRAIESENPSDVRLVTRIPAAEGVSESLNLAGDAYVPQKRKLWAKQAENSRAVRLYTSSQQSR